MVLSWAIEKDEILQYENFNGCSTKVSLSKMRNPDWILTPSASKNTKPRALHLMNNPIAFFAISLVFSESRIVLPVLGHLQGPKHGNWSMLISILIEMISSFPLQQEGQKNPSWILCFWNGVAVSLLGLLYFRWIFRIYGLVLFGYAHWNVIFVIQLYSYTPLVVQFFFGS